MPIISQDSQIQLLVDFIVFKLKKDGTNKKSDGKKTCDELGYDIADF